MSNPSPHPANRATLDDGAPACSTRRPRVLITEDELVIAMDLRRRLTRLGYEVTGVAVSGEDAALQAGDQQPDLVLMDITLQGEVDGIGAAAAIRQRFDLPVIFLSANTDQQTRERAGETHPFNFLLKPFQDADLKFSIEMALYHHSIARHLRAVRDELEVKAAARTVELADANAALREQNAHQAIIMQELRAAKLAAQSANLAKSEFLSGISHELLTPMNGIIGMTDILAEISHEPEQREYIDIVKMSAETLLSLINDLLDFSVVESGRLSLSPSVCVVREQVAACLSPLAHRARSKGIALNSRFSDDVPVQALLDPERLGQVLIQVVSNAIKFSDHGEVWVEVDQLSRTAGQTHLHFTVRDSGIGIPLDKQERVFEPFVQADGSDRRRHGGVGLGLAIASSLVDLMGGKIWFTSEPGVGTTFHFTLSAGTPER